MKLDRAKLALVATLAVVGVTVVGVIAFSLFAAQPLGKINLKSFHIDSSANGDFVVMQLTGTLQGLGDSTGYAELDVVKGEFPTFDGTGVVVFIAANHDILVGVIAAQRDSEGAISAEFHWRDSVTLHDGTTVASTGRFEDHRPAGARMFFCCCDCYQPCGTCAGTCCPS
jgi:hypothetical protein